MASGVRSRRKAIALKVACEESLGAGIIFFSLSFRIEIDVVASTAALFFDFSEIGALVPVGFDVVVSVVVPRDRVEARGFGGAAGNDDIGHADDGGGVHAATEFGEDRAIGTDTTLEGRGEDAAEVLLVFGVGAVTDSLVRIEIPILTDGVLSGPEE